MSDNYYDIKYVKRASIDIVRWDQCINEAQNSLIYAYSFYLDNMASHWDALILNDYEAVMPVTWNRKWGIKYLYQPPFSQQLGIFGNKAFDENQVAAFIKIAKEKFSFAEIFLNSSNTFSEGLKKNNYLLDLGGSYDIVSGSYQKKLHYNLARSKKNNLSYATSENYKEVIEQYRNQYGHRFAHVTKKDYLRFFRMCHILNEKKMIIVRKVSNNNSDLLAIALLFRDSKRLYNIMSVTLPIGRALRANHFLLDELVKEFSGQKLILDFEGSEIPGIAKFYEEFGSTNESYYFLRYNNLPSPIRRLKK